MDWDTEFLFSKYNIKQSSNNLDYQGQGDDGFTEKHRQCWHKHISHIKHSRTVHKYMHNTLMVSAHLSKWQGWSSGGKRDVTHIPSDVESISHDHLPKSEITTRPPVSREPGIGLGNRREMGKDPETQRGVKGGKWEKRKKGINNAVCFTPHRLASLFFH